MKIRVDRPPHPLVHLFPVNYRIQVHKRSRHCSLVGDDTL